MDDEEVIQTLAPQTALGMVVLVYLEHIDDEDEVDVIAADAQQLAIDEVDDEVEEAHPQQYAHEVLVTNE